MTLLKVWREEIKKWIAIEENYPNSLPPKDPWRIANDTAHWYYDAEAYQTFVPMKKKELPEFPSGGKYRYIGKTNGGHIIEDFSKGIYDERPTTRIQLENYLSELREYEKLNKHKWVVTEPFYTKGETFWYFNIKLNNFFGTKVYTEKEQLIYVGSSYDGYLMEVK